MATSTREQARETAYQLLMEGTKPSVQKIREQLGRGSDKTILDGLNEFWEELGQLIADWRTYPSIPNDLAKAMNEWWHLALKQANVSLDDERKEMKLLVDEAEAKKEAAHTEREQALKQVDALSQANDQLREQIKTLETAYHGQVKEITALTTENKVLYAEKETLTNQVRSLKNEHKDALQTAYNRAEATENKLVRQMDGWKTQAEKLEATLSKKEEEWKTSNQKLLRQNEQLQQQLQETNSNVRQAEKTIDDLTKQLESAEQSLQKLESNYKQAIQGTEKKVEDLRTENSKMQATITAFEAKESSWLASQRNMEDKFTQLLETIRPSASK